MYWSLILNWWRVDNYGVIELGAASSESNMRAGMPQLANTGMVLSPQPIIIHTSNTLFHYRYLCAAVKNTTELKFGILLIVRLPVLRTGLKPIHRTTSFPTHHRSYLRLLVIDSNACEWSRMRSKSLPLMMEDSRLWTFEFQIYTRARFYK